MTVCARDLKAGDVIEWEGGMLNVDAAYFANGRDGSPPKMIALPEHTKSAVAIKVIAGGRSYLLHPAQQVALLRVVL